jgi:hypothetical protein
MAYGSNGQGNQSRGGSNSNSNFRGNNNARAASTGATGTAGVRKAILRTGLFAPTRDGAKDIASVQVKETVTIPAGSYINLYLSDSKSEKGPKYNLSVMPAVAKKVQ